MPDETDDALPSDSQPADETAHPAKPGVAPKAPPPPKSPQPNGAAPPAPEPEAVEPVPSTALEREHAEMRDRLLRTLAEMENLRKRTEREIVDARTYAVTAFARDILVVADNMHRAMHALDVEIRDQAEGEVKALLDGVELTERELLNALTKHGVKRVEPHGERFDPNKHQAMYEVPDASVPAGTVVQVVQAGYLIGERVLRPALVAISKGGPKVAKAETTADATDSVENGKAGN